MCADPPAHAHAIFLMRRFVLGTAIVPCRLYFGHGTKAAGRPWRKLNKAGAGVSCPPPAPSPRGPLQAHSPGPLSRPALIRISLFAGGGAGNFLLLTLVRPRLHSTQHGQFGLLPTPSCWLNYQAPAGPSQRAKPGTAMARPQNNSTPYPKPSRKLRESTAAMQAPTARCRCKWAPAPRDSTPTASTRRTPRHRGSRSFIHLNRLGSQSQWPLGWLWLLALP